MISVYTCVSLLRNLPFPAFIKELGSRHRYTLWNDRMEALSGIEEAEMLGRRDDHFLDREVSEAQERTEATIAPESSVTSNSWCLPGVDHSVSVHITRLTLASSVEILIGIVTDTGNSQGSQDREMAAILGHDLSGPLHNLRNLSLHLRDEWDQKNRGELQEIHEALVESSQNLIRTVTNLRDFGRYAAGWSHPSYREGPLVLHLAPSLQLAGEAAREKGVSLEVVLDEELALATDSNMLGIIVRNLLFNSIKFSPSGSAVRLSAKQRPTLVEIVVEDCGPGMAEEDLERANRGGRPASRKGSAGEPGTGIGLLLCHSTAAKLGASLRFENKDNGGLSVTIRHPR